MGGAPRALRLGRQAGGRSPQDAPGDSDSESAATAQGPGLLNAVPLPRPLPVTLAVAGSVSVWRPAGLSWWLPTGSAIMMGLGAAGDSGPGGLQGAGLGRPQCARPMAAPGHWQHHDDHWHRAARLRVGKRLACHWQPEITEAHWQDRDDQCQNLNFLNSRPTGKLGLPSLPVSVRGENKRASAADNFNRGAHTCVLADHRHDVGHCSGAVEVSAQTASR